MIKQFFNKDLKENPKNGYAFAWIAAIRQHYQEYGRAITALDQAIKYIPKKDKAYRTWVYSNKASVYQELDEYDKALESIESFKKRPLNKEYAVVFLDDTSTALRRDTVAKEMVPPKAPSPFVEEPIPRRICAEPKREP